MTTFNQIQEIILPSIIERIANKQGLANFAKIRAKFEGWLKVELCEVLSNYFDDVLPEQKRIDLSFNKWIIEIKTLNTNYRHPNVKNMHRPITKNVQGVLDDINKLQKISNKKRGIVFVVFPVNEKNQNWIGHSNKITSKLKQYKISDFHFINGVPGLIYFGEV